jgi:hypothetical protein
MRFGHPSILAGRLDGGGGLHGLAESLHRDARRRRDALIATRKIGGGAFRQNGLVDLQHHGDGIIGQRR